jgi:predicted CoA-binding protein
MSGALPGGRPAPGSPEHMRDLLRRARTIAIVGASTDPWRPSFGIAGYLKRAGYRVIPVNPHELGRDLGGEPFRASLRDIEEPVDLVDVFRRPDAVPAVVEDAIAIGAPAIWMQPGARSEPAATRARAAGIDVVMDRCISVEHARLGR